MAAPLILILAVGVAAFLVMGEKKTSSVPKPGKRPGEEIMNSEEAGFMTRLPNGSLKYRDDALILAGMMLMGNSITETATPGLYRLAQNVANLGDLQPPSVIDGITFDNAYYAARDRHARGMDIWVSPTLFQPPTANVPRDLYASPAGAKIPKEAVLALLRAAKDPWIEQLGALPPAGA